MTGLSLGRESPILRGRPQNFVFVITLLLLVLQQQQQQQQQLLLLLLLLLPFSARRLINTKPSPRGFAVVMWSLLLVFV